MKFRRYAYATVFNREQNEAILLPAFNFNYPFMRKFNCISDEVGKNLDKLGFVSFYDRRFFSNVRPVIDHYPFGINLGFKLIKNKLQYLVHIGFSFHQLFLPCLNG